VREEKGRKEGKKKERKGRGQGNGRGRLEREKNKGRDLGSPFTVGLPHRILDAPLYV